MWKLKYLFGKKNDKQDRKKRDKYKLTTLLMTYKKFFKKTHLLLNITL